MPADIPDCPNCGTSMRLGDWVEEPPDGGPETYFYRCQHCGHKSYGGDVDSRATDT